MKIAGVDTYNAAGSNTQIQYNSGSAFAGVPTLTYDGTTLRATGSFTGSFTGSLLGTASYSSNTNPAGSDLQLQFKSGSALAANSSFAVVTGAFPRLRIDSTNNSGIQLLESAAPRWSIASYSGGTFTFYNDGINQEAIGITGIVATFRSRLLVAGGTDDATTALQVNGAARIGTTAVVGAATSAASAQLTVTSTNRGFLPPRMTTTQISAISAPAAGLVVYNTTLNLLCFFNGATWQRVPSTAM